MEAQVRPVAREGNSAAPVNVASVRQYSPLRYPGGKTWLVPQIKEWLESLPRGRTLFEPFAGGAVASLTAVIEGFVKRAVLVERDPDVAAFWHAALERPEELATRVRAFEPTRGSIEALSANGSRFERGFRALVLNRTRRGGILANGAALMRDGENGKGLRSRWYPETLARRIERIGECRDRIEILEEDGLQVLAEHREDKDAAFFVDPPYSAGNGKRAGRRLYLHNDLDHERLFDLMGSVVGSFMMTYEDCSEIRRMADEHELGFELVPMKSTHHAVMNELLIFP